MWREGELPFPNKDFFYGNMTFIMAADNIVFRVHNASFSMVFILKATELDGYHCLWNWHNTITTLFVLKNYVICSSRCFIAKRAITVGTNRFLFSLYIFFPRYYHTKIRKNKTSAIFYLLPECAAPRSWEWRERQKQNTELHTFLHKLSLAIHLSSSAAIRSLTVPSSAQTPVIFYSPS